MKLKRKILSAFAITIMTAAITCISSNSYAATDSNGLNLGLEVFRNSGYSYMAIEKIMWKISAYDSNGTTIPNKNRAIYCMKGGPGFGSTTSMGSTEPQKRKYTEYFDMKDYDSISTPYKDVLPSGENYNSLVWVLEHCYVPAPSANPTTEQINNAKSYKNELLTAAGIPVDGMSDDEIDIAQQFAIWYFTNNDAYKTDGNVQLYISKYPNQVSTMSPTLGDYFDDWDRDEYVKDLIAYFIDNAKANASKAPDKTTGQNPISLTSNSASIFSTSSNYIIGPYRINQIGSNSEYTLEGKLTTTDGSTNVSYTLLDSNKNVTNKSLKDLVGNDFYISVPNTQSDVRNLKFKINTSTYVTDVTFWSVKGANAAEQPVAEVNRGRKPYELTVDMPPLTEFDLALRKFITKINGVAVDTREPVVSAETLAKLKSGEIKTVTKTHTKDPLIVDTGDTVLYTIRIYNEGNINGYAKEITDYLPAGLELKAGSQINTDNGWTNPLGDGKTIVTSKLANNLLNKFDGTTLAYADVEVECTVTAQYGANNVSMKNVAEITKHSDEAGNENVVDRDSTPKNLTSDQRQNYNPGSSTKGWGYEDDDDYEELLLPKARFDLALRKFITNINGKELVNSDGTYVREPKIDVTALANKTATTANYNHRKDPVGVAVGDIVIYTIRVYNEGKLDGYASSVTDYLPPQLEFVTDDDENFNAKYGWVIDSSLRKATTRNLSKQYDDDNLLKAFDGTTLDSRELKIKCRVKSTRDLDKVITNIAEITEFTDAEGNEIIDIDSQAKNVVLPSDENLPDYKGNESNKSILSDSTYFYKGQQDDDDFEKLILEEFDLALRKFITKINDVPPTISREPKFTKVIDENGNYIYEHTKEPLEVESTDIVEYTIRIFNEGDIAGYAKVVKDDIPEGLEFLPNNELNKEYRWIMLDKDGNETTDVSKSAFITTDYLSKEQEKSSESNLLKAFDQDSMESPDYRDVKVEFKVIAPNTHPGIITNIAEIADDSDENGNPINDRDSTPNNDNFKEDDIDVEHIKLKYFDLALRKFITGVNDKEVTNRIPVFKIDENGKYVYEHTKEPVDVLNGDIVTYTLRIFNEGTIAGYAKEVKDDIPDGLEFLPENDLNKEYRWVMLDEEGNETDDIAKAKSIKTDYLSMEQSTENLLKAFDEKTMESPDYRDVKIAFKVTEPNTSDRIIINQAQISDDSDEEGKPVIDIDSTPDKWIDGEDDQDIEKIKVKYFDLALRKWVTQAIVIENGKETVTETGHKAEDDPEEVVKVELVESKLNKVVVKFRYKIRITNEGEIAGYATEISDYIPQGLKFVQADNPNWKEVDGKIVTEQLKDTLLQPGETAEVEVLLTWINAKDNFNLKVNVAEISKDKNDSNTPDIDSTPNNKKDGEDDIDDAPVILSIKTGKVVPVEIIATVAGSMLLVAGSTVLIKKYVLI